MGSINISREQKCAICKYWFDPACTAIKPRAPQMNLWDVENNAQKMCLQKGFDTSAMNSCFKFKNKLEII